MDSEDIASLYASLSINSRDGPVQLLDGNLMNDAKHRLSLCLVGTILSSKWVNRDAFMRVIGKFWQVKKGLDIESVLGNIFSFHFRDEYDLNRVSSGSPWSFDNALIAMEKPVGMGTMESLSFSQADFWVQIHQVPLLCITKEIGRFLGGMIGAVLDRSSFFSPVITDSNWRIDRGKEKLVPEPMASEGIISSSSIQVVMEDVIGRGSASEVEPGEVVTSHQLEEVVNKLERNMFANATINGEVIVGNANGNELFGLCEKTVGTLPIIQDIYNPFRGIEKEAHGLYEKPISIISDSNIKFGPIRVNKVDEPINNIIPCSDSPSFSSGSVSETTRVAGNKRGRKSNRIRKLGISKAKLEVHCGKRKSAPAEDGEFIGSKKVKRMVGEVDSEVKSNKSGNRSVSVGEVTSVSVSTT
ncbi:hypothetical protein EZV62_024789 [Acer yangbiense]|uniref:DUF4283 domain-containing protein n=1 Tax=Acer yangbiense TaxID=1000413 RepID=A0A5C7GVT2_9ROSI|nr:hypothetical protein EZV62_024789 [Acer yangbiense]